LPYSRRFCCMVFLWLFLPYGAGIAINVSADIIRLCFNIFLDIVSIFFSLGMEVYSCLERKPILAWNGNPFQPRTETHSSLEWKTCLVRG